MLPGDLTDFQPTQKWVTLGCTLLNTMLSCPEGIRYLTEDKLVSQMAACFSDIDEVRSTDNITCWSLTIKQSGRPSAHPIFSRDRIDRTLTHGYFEMLGTMTKSRDGLAYVVVGLRKPITDDSVCSTSSASSPRSTTSRISLHESKLFGTLSSVSTIRCVLITPGLCLC